MKSRRRTGHNIRSNTRLVAVNSMASEVDSISFKCKVAETSYQLELPSSSTIAEAKVIHYSVPSRL